MPDSSISHVAVSFAKKFGTVAAVFLIGKYDLSIAWLIGPVILSVVRDEWKRETDMKRNIAKATAMSSEKEVILARVDDLPSWVFFPDVERAEWLNKVFKQVWPNVNSYAKALLKESIEPGVRDALAAYKLHGFAFERMILGSIPIRIGGVKVYDKNVSRNEIIMDLDIFYAGDCDISFSLSGVKGGIKDFQLHGLCRVVMKPLISTMPLVGGLQIFFLNNPTIDFNLVGVADLLDMPGLSDILRRIIVEQVAAMMVLPNKLPIQLSDAVPATELKTPEPEGVLRVHVVEAKDLMKKDISVLGKGKSDPYAVLNIGAQQFRTQTIDNTVNPKWDYWCECTVSELFGQKIHLKLFDSDDLSKNDENLGRATIDVNQVIKKGEVDLWVTLEDAKHGMIHVRMMWLTLSNNSQDLAAALLETQTLRVTSMSTAVLIVFLDAVKNLPQARPQSKPDPYVVLTVNKKTEQTVTLHRTSDPVFEQGYTFLVQHPRTDSLFIKIIDNKTSQTLGQLEQPMLALLEKPNLQIEKQPFNVPKSGPETKILMSLTLRVLKRDAPVTMDEADGDNFSLDGESQPLMKLGSIKKPPHSPVKKQISTQSTGSTTSLGGLSAGGVEESIVSQTASSVESPHLDIRHRNNSISSSSGEAGLGRIHLTLRYSTQRQRLSVIVHKIVNLPLKDPTNIPDPYVKLYLLPDRKDSKRKTETMKDNCNPVFEETLEYVLSSGDLNSRQLEVSVVTKKGWYASVMGQVMVNLADLDLAQALTLWFDLLPEIPRDV